ncbi:hypothetical protein QZH41_005861 [Actinostola sp. cb2023]|nr:hypothetical protein QZH41_005861 [Actinostola sp. cb2023]
MPKGSWWTDQVKTCKSIDQAWSILDVEFEDKRKLMDSLLAEINNYKPVKNDSKSLTYYATTISVYVNDMEDNGCSVKDASESPFFMSQLLSKLDPRDNVEFGREMQRQKKEENVTSLIDWLHQEATLRSRGEKDTDSEDMSERNQFQRAANFQRACAANQRRSDNHATNNEVYDDQTCPLGCAEKHLLPACPSYQDSTVSQRWDIVKQNKRCRKCLRASHHTNDCKKPEGTSCDKCRKNHHRSLHSEKRGVPSSDLNPNAPSFSGQRVSSNNNNIQNNTSKQNAKEEKTVTGLCPVQKIKIFNNSGESIEILAMLDSGSNTSLLSKKTVKQLGLSGPQTHLTMNLAGGETKSEVSDLLEITVTPVAEEGIKKSLHVYTVARPCSGPKTVSRKLVDSYPHFKPISDKVHLSGGTIDLLIGTDFADAFVDIHTISGGPGEPIAKRNCFGWYALGQFDTKTTTRSMSGVQSVSVGTVSILEDITKLLHQDQLGIKPTELCTCREDVLRENKFVKSLSDSTTLVDGRIQVKMPWKESGPPKRSNYGIALKRMNSSEKSFKKKNCFDIIDAEVQKLVDQGFVTKGHDGQSLNDHLEKGPNYINSLLDVLMAWRWDAVAYAGDVRKMFNQVMVHTEDQIFHRFLWRRSASELPTIYQWLRLNFGDKPAPDIAANSINTLAKVSQTEFPEAAKELQEHAYVDDIGGSRPNVTEAKQITEDIDTILAKGQFQIKAWHSNSKEIDQSEGEQSTDLLGHKWDKQQDTFSFKKSEIVFQSKDFSKRSCLALLTQLWDPIGLVSPVTVKFRIDLQER